MSFSPVGQRVEEKEGEGRWQEETVKRTKKRLVGGDAFNARQRAVVVAIGLASSSYSLAI